MELWTALIVAGIGVLLGLRLRVPGLLAASALTATLAIAHAVAGGLSWLTGAAVTFAWLAALQAGYLVGLLVSQTRAFSTVPRSYWLTAMAASLALVIGGGFGWLIRGAATATRPASPDVVVFWDGNLEAEGALAKLLENTGSGNAVGVNDTHGRVWGLEASFSFRSVDGRPCRRYEFSGQTRRFAGYACRSTDGRWSVHAHLELPNKAAGSQFAPARGDNDGALDMAIRAAMDGDALPLTEESKLIADRWASGSK